MYIVNVECMQHLSSAIPLFKMCKPSHRTPFNDVKNDQASAASVFAFASDFWYRALYVWGKKYLFAPYV